MRSAEEGEIGFPESRADRGRPTTTGPSPVEEQLRSRLRKASNRLVTRSESRQLPLRLAEDEGWSSGRPEVQQ